MCPRAGTLRDRTPLAPLGAKKRVGTHTRLRDAASALGISGVVRRLPSRSYADLGVPPRPPRPVSGLVPPGAEALSESRFGSARACGPGRYEDPGERDQRKSTRAVRRSSNPFTVSRRRCEASAASFYVVSTRRAATSRWCAPPTTSSRCTGRPLLSPPRSTSPDPRRLSPAPIRHTMPPNSLVTIAAAA